jgi:hypothetical protein
MVGSGRSEITEREEPRSGEGQGLGRKSKNCFQAYFV